MKRGVASCRRAKQAIAIPVHPLRARFNPAVAHPGRIADHDVESALCHDVRKVHIVGKEIELTVLGSTQNLFRLRDARVELAAPRQVRRAHAAEQVLLRRCGLLQLAFVDIDRLVQQLAGDALIVSANHPRERRPLGLRRSPIAREEIRLRAQCGHPLAIDVAASVAEEVGGAEERVALQDVAVEVRQRRNVFDRHVALRHDRQPESQLTKPDCLRLQIHSEQRPFNDQLAVDVAAQHFLDGVQRREEECARSASRIENRDRFEPLRISAAPFRDGALGQGVDDAFRRVETSARGALVVRHQRLEYFAEHFGIDVRAGGVDLVDAEREALEHVVDDALQQSVRKSELRVAALER